MTSPITLPLVTDALTWLSDGATILAALATLAAAVAAFLAIRQTHKLNIEKAQPYIVVSLEPHEQVPWIMELVVRNLGQTAATNVKISFNQSPARAQKKEEDEHDHLLLPRSFPVLVPGQRWGTTWDSIFERHKSGLPNRYEVTITYLGIDGKTQPAKKYVIDWDTYFSRGHLDVKTLHHVAKELSEIKTVLKNRH